MTCPTKLPWQMTSGEYHRARRPFFVNVPVERVRLAEGPPPDLGRLMDRGFARPDPGRQQRVMRDGFYDQDIRWLLVKDRDFIQPDAPDVLPVELWLREDAVRAADKEHRITGVEIEVWGPTWGWFTSGDPRMHLGIERAQIETAIAAKRGTPMIRTWVQNSLSILDPSVVETMIVSPHDAWLDAASHGHRLAVQLAMEEGLPVPADMRIEYDLPSGTDDWGPIDRQMGVVRRHVGQLVRLAGGGWTGVEREDAERSVPVLGLVKLLFSDLATIGRQVDSPLGRVFAFAARDLRLPGQESGMSAVDELVASWHRYAMDLSPERQGASWYRGTDQAARGIADWARRLDADVAARDAEWIDADLSVHQPLIDLMWSAPLRWLPGVEALGQASVDAWR